MFRGRDDELQSEDEDERSAADGGEEPGDEDDVSCFGSGCCRRVASSVEDLGGLGEPGDLADSREVIGHGERSRLQLLFKLAGTENACNCVGCSILAFEGV